MAEQLHDDRFDEFLKKSIENYSESPTERVWEGIESQLPAKKTVMWRRSRWWLSAAAVALIGIITCQHLHYQREVEQLREELLRYHMAQNQIKTEQSQVPPASVEHAEGPNGSLAPAQPNRTHAEPLQPKRAVVSPSGPSDRSGPLQPIVASRPKHDSSAVTEPNDTPVISHATEPALAVSTPASTPSAIEPMGTLALLPRLDFTLQKNLPAWKLPTSPALFSRGNTGLWWVGVSGETARITKSFGKGHSSQHGGGHMTHHDEPTSITGWRWSAGPMATRYLNSHLWVSSGFQYAEANFSTTHRPKLRLNEGHHGQHSHEHQFDYTLALPGATANISIRVEQSDSTEVIPENETLQFSVQTHQRFSYARLPVQLGWQVPFGKLGLNLSAGIVGNFLLDSQLDIAGLEVGDPRFHVHGEKNAPQPRFDKTNQFFLELTAGASILWNPTPHWRLQVGPNLHLQLAEASADPTIGSRSHGAGLHSAVCYFF